MHHLYSCKFFVFIYVQSNAKAKFDETLEAHVRLGIEKGRSELVFDAFLFSGNVYLSFYFVD